MEPVTVEKNHLFVDGRRMSSLTLCKGRELFGRAWWDGESV